MSTSPHLHHRHDAPQFALHLDIPLHDDCVGQKRGTVGTETKVGVSILQLRGHQHRDAHTCQRGDQARERFTEVGAERRCHGKFEARQGIDDHPCGFQAVDLIEQQTHDLVDGQIRGLGIDQTHAIAVDQIRKRPVVKRIGPALERGNHACFSAPCAFCQERRGQDALTGAGGARHEQRVAPWQAAAEHLVQTGHTHAEAGLQSGGTGVIVTGHDGARRREDLNAGRCDAERMQSGQRGLSAHFGYFHFANHGVALHVLAQPDQPVGHGEDWIGVRVRKVFADQKRGGLPTGHEHAQLLHELLEGLVGCAFDRTRQHHRAERIHEHKGRVVRLNFRDDALQDRIEVARERVLRQVDEAD